MNGLHPLPHCWMRKMGALLLWTAWRCKKINCCTQSTRHRLACWQRFRRMVAHSMLLPQHKVPHWPKLFALAHSMAGSILLSQARAGNSPFERLVLIAPMISILGASTLRPVRAGIEIADIFGLGAVYAPGAGARSSS